jgi:hypothetical protein
MKSFVHFESLYSFRGDARANQLSLEKGSILRVDARQAAASHDGWTWGSLLVDGSDGKDIFGWFPTGYVTATTAPYQRNRLPWIPEEPSDRQAPEARDDDFGGAALGGRSPALDYSTPAAVGDKDNSNPFTTFMAGPLDHMQGDDRITITASSKQRRLGQRFQKGWQKVGTSSAKLLPRRKVAPADPWMPSVRITPSAIP